MSIHQGGNECGFVTKSLKGSENSKIWSGKANNITHTLLDTWQRIIILLRLFWLGAVRGTNPPRPGDGGDPLARLGSSCGRSAVYKAFRLFVRDRVKLCTLSRGELLKIGPIVNYAVKYLLSVVLLPFSFDIFALSKNISLFCPLDDLF